MTLAAVLIAWQPASAATVDTSAYYQLVSRDSGKAIDVSGASTANSAQIVQNTISTATSQQWQFIDSGNGYYRIKNRNSGKVLDITAHSTADGAQAIQYTDNNATNQQFSVVDTTAGYVKLINHNSGKVIDLTAGSNANGALIEQWTDNGGTNQQWQLVKLGSASPSPTGPPTKNISIPNTLGTHDPSRLINDGGSYYFYSTGSNIPVWYTTDGSHWQQGPAVFPNGLPAWQKTLVPKNDGHDVWAPDIIYFNGLFHLYYAVSGDDSAAVGLATTPTLNPNASTYKWTDRGAVVSSGPSDRFSTIDPAPIFDASGNLWLSWGSGYVDTWSDPEIFLTRLDNTTGLRSSSDTTNHPLVLGHVEASYIQYHNGYYYLFWNTGGCCSGASSTYLIHVARSSTITGPYVDKNGTAGSAVNFLGSHGSVHGPGQIGVLSQNGIDYYTYHYYPDSGGSVLGLGTITWGSDGWPNA